MRAKKAYIASPLGICHAPTWSKHAGRYSPTKKFFERAVSGKDVCRDGFPGRDRQPPPVCLRHEGRKISERFVKRACLRRVHELFVNLRGHALHDDLGLDAALANAF